MRVCYAYRGKIKAITSCSLATLEIDDHVKHFALWDIQKCNSLAKLIQDCVHRLLTIFSVWKWTIQIVSRCFLLDHNESFSVFFSFRGTWECVSPSQSKPNEPVRPQHVFWTETSRNETHEEGFLWAAVKHLIRDSQTTP